ncbi:MAG TPA: CaiB/BaiF CoA-transferase family protein [Thermomicrobiales bacterium]|nr:CaiB/BaiF CoA-transferase family protein [Thermomicrobiales bacterium]
MTSDAPLAGYRVVDLTRYGPGPYCAMLLGDLGADVIVVDDGTPPESMGRRGAMGGEVAELLKAVEFMRRRARRIALDLRQSDDQLVMRRLIERADVVLEGFRPGVAARLGLDADTLLAEHPRLVYCSISGYGQDGPYRTMAGHDINYLALGGLLGLTGAAGGLPVAPGTLVADLAGGGLPAAVAVLGALLARERSGSGQHIDVSVQEGVAALVAPLLSLLHGGQPVERGTSVFTGAAPWYGVYETADGAHVAVGAIEPWFWAELCAQLGRPEWAAQQSERAAWPAIRAEMETIFRGGTRTEWVERLAQLDTCVTPVWSLEETRNDPQLRARGAFGADAAVHALPRLDSVDREIPAPHSPNADRDALLRELGLAE